MIPTVQLEPPTRFVYPQDGKVYFLAVIDWEKQQLILERASRISSHLPVVDEKAVGPLPRLEEAQQFLTTLTDEEGRPRLGRCRLTHEIEETGKFLTAKWYEESWVP